MREKEQGCKYCVNNKEKLLFFMAKRGILILILFFCFGGESMAFFLDTNIGFGESLASSGIGFLIVFIGLVCLIALVALMGSVCTKVLNDGKKTEKKAPTAPVKTASVAPAAPVAIANRDELVVAFSAAVAEELGTDVSAIRVVSLKEIG